MTTEEWGRLPQWVRTAIIDAGYGASQIGRVQYDLAARPARIDVALAPTMPKDVEFTFVVEPRQ